VPVKSGQDQFEMIQKSGLWISDDLGLKVQHIRVVDCVAKHVRVIGKGNKERLVPLPESFGRVQALSLTGKTKDDYFFTKKPGGKQPCAHATRAYLKKLNDKRVLKKSVPHTYVTRLLEKDVQLLDIQALFGMKSSSQRRFTLMPGRSG
jgi:integrase/recombinase XerD